MRAKELLHLIPEEIFQTLAIETKVDHQVKKLNGYLMFQLILYSMINRKRVSLRVMEEFLKSSSFRTLSNNPEIDSRFNSLSDRIAMIKYEYFEKIFYFVYDLFSKYLGEEHSIIRYDSTMVAVSSKLFQDGMRVGRKAGEDKKQYKFTFKMHGSLPACFQIFSEQIYLSEDIALSKIILNEENNGENVIVFDRGLRAKKTFEKLSVDDVTFVTRTYLNIRYNVLQENKIDKKPNDATVTILEDSTILLNYTINPKVRHRFRLIKAVIDNTKEEIFFLSNSETLSAYEIAEIYKSRWEIEIFFKFLKQELNVSHLVSRDPNGIKVMMYMTLITAILIIVYRKLNKVSSFKIAKLRFSLELETTLIGQIVYLCGGNLDKFNSIYDP
jgi:transposase